MSLATRFLWTPPTPRLPWWPPPRTAWSRWAPTPAPTTATISTRVPRASALPPLSRP